MLKAYKKAFLLEGSSSKRPPADFASSEPVRETTWRFGVRKNAAISSSRVGVFFDTLSCCSCRAELVYEVVANFIEFSLLFCGLQLKDGQAPAFILHGHFDLAPLRGFGLELRSKGQSVDPDGKKKHDRGERKYRLPDQPPPRQKGSRKVALPGWGCPAHPGFSRLRKVELKGPHQMGLQVKGCRLRWQGIGQQTGSPSILF